MKKSIEAEILGFDPETGMPFDERSGLWIGDTVGQMKDLWESPSEISLQDQLEAYKRININVDGSFAASQSSGQNDVIFREYYIPKNKTGYKARAGITLGKPIEGDGIHVSSYHIRGTEMTNRFLYRNEGQGAIQLSAVDHEGTTLELSYIRDGEIKGGELRGHALYQGSPDPKFKFDSDIVQRAIIEGPVMYDVKGGGAVVLDYRADDNRLSIVGSMGGRSVHMSFLPQVDIFGILKKLVPPHVLENPLKIPGGLDNDRWSEADNNYEWGIEMS